MHDPHLCCLWEYVSDYRSSVRLGSGCQEPPSNHLYVDVSCTLALIHSLESAARVSNRPSQNGATF